MPNTHLSGDSGPPHKEERRVGDPQTPRPQERMAFAAIGGCRTEQSGFIYYLYILARSLS